MTVDFNAQFFENPEVSEFITRTASEDYDMSQPEAIRLRAMISAQYRMMNNTWFQYEVGTITREQLESLLYPAVLNYQRRGRMRLEWQKGEDRHLLDPDLVEYLDSKIYATTRSSDSNEEAIAKLRVESNEAIRNHDSDAIVALFDEKYQITTGSGVLYHGSAETEKKTWDEIFDQFPDVVYVRTPSKIEISASETRAAETGDWVGTWTTPNGEIRLSGRYFASWIMVNGEWKLQSEMFVTMDCSGEDC